MRVSYETTTDDHVYLLQVISDRMGMRSRPYWSYMLVTGLVGSLFLLIFSNGPLLSTISPLVTIGVFGLIVIPVLNKRGVRRKTRKMVERLRDGTDTIFSAEVREDGLYLTELGSETRMDWVNLEAVRETDQYIEILFRPHGVVIVAKRAFETQDAVMRFTELVESHGPC